MIIIKKYILLIYNEILFSQIIIMFFSLKIVLFIQNQYKLVETMF